MSDDIGRGDLAWPPERWEELDSLAADTAAGSVVFRNLIDYREQPGATNVRIAGNNVDVERREHDFQFNMQDEDDEDLERRIQLAAQELALAEDRFVLCALPRDNAQDSNNLLHREFIRAKNTLRGNGVQQGFGLAVSTHALTDLESERVGAKSGLEVVERVVGTTVAQTNALGTEPFDEIHGIILQASPPAYRLVRAYGPRLRVLGKEGGNIVLFRMEEGIAAR